VGAFSIPLHGISLTISSTLSSSSCYPYNISNILPTLQNKEILRTPPTPKDLNSVARMNEWEDFASPNGYKAAAQTGIRKKFAPCSLPRSA
jgi:hypothetical protein